jgi:hypothetical protein
VLGWWTLKGKTGYFWCTRWPGREIAFGGFETKLKKASFLTTGKQIGFEQKGNRLILKGLPKESPDHVAGITAIKMEFASAPKQRLGAGYVLI